MDCVKNRRMVGPMLFNLTVSFSLFTANRGYVHCQRLAGALPLRLCLLHQTIQINLMAALDMAVLEF